MSILFLYIFLINIYQYASSKKYEQIIISLSSDHENINKTKLIINSIINQGIKRELFQILLILSLNDYKTVEELPEEIQFLLNLALIKIKFIKGKITEFSRTLITMKIYRNYPIILINNECILPHGWLEMFIKDHFKYPNDAIATSIQHFYGKKGKIKEFSEGFKGEKFGIFNHVTEMVFNFAIFNIDLGGILYPKNFFNNNFFYNENLFVKIVNDSEDFWQSAFIMLEDKILRQSSKIFDFTKYLLNDINNKSLYINKTILLEKKKISFIKEFPNFEEAIIRRQKKIIVSITSYPKRFIFLPDLMKFIRNQNFQINKKFFFIYKEEMKYYNLKINDVEVIKTEKNLRSHLKYFYAMKNFKDQAIITLDDDIGYTKGTFKSLFNSYIENPNVISGRRSHLMTYKNNGELKSYYNWLIEQNFIKEASFDITLTNVGGSIFPPDILNVNDDYLNIINETITCDDLTLKYFANMKGIPMKWAFNKHFLGKRRRLPKISAKPLFMINLIKNDICINKLNMMINKTLLKNLCVQYRNILTGNLIYLFDIHNEMRFNKILYFEIYAYSYCPINTQITFFIYFESYEANCFFNNSNKMAFNMNNLKSRAVASCYMNDNEKEFDFYFPQAKSNDGIFFNICHYRKYLTTIFMQFFCQEENNCILKAILLEKIYYDNFPVEINDEQYICKVNEKNNSLIKIFPVTQKFICNKKNHFENITKIFVSGIPKILDITQEIIDNNKLPNQFIISRIIHTSLNKKNKIIIIGKLTDDLKEKSYEFSINVLFPDEVLECKLKPYSKYVFSRIYCNNNLQFQNKILIENQIVYSKSNKEEILLINEETFIRIELNKTYQEYLERNKYYTNYLNSKNYWIKKVKIDILLMILLLLKLTSHEYLKDIFFFK